MVLWRTLIALSALRQAHRFGEVSRDLLLTREDYRATRDLLRELPTTGVADPLSPRTVTVAAELHARVNAAGFPRTLVGDDLTARPWLTRAQAREWLGRSYNTAKVHLAELEERGILISSIGPANRER